MVQYHFRTPDGPSLGPIGSDEFQQRQEAGEINDGTMVWRSGMVDWLTYADLRAADQRAVEPLSAQASTKPSKSAPAAFANRTAFCACASCRQEWPEALLTLMDGKRICGNCQNNGKEQQKEGRRKAGIGTSAWAWALMILAVVCAVCLTYKVKRYGVRLPKGPVEPLTEPSKYGK